MSAIRCLAISINFMPWMEAALQQPESDTKTFVRIQITHIFLALIMDILRYYCCRRGDTIRTGLMFIVCYVATFCKMSPFEICAPFCNIAFFCFTQITRRRILRLRHRDKHTHARTYEHVSDSQSRVRMTLLFL